MGRLTKEFDDRLLGVTDDRVATYGHPAKTFDNIAVLQLVVRECPDARIRHALEMICVKMVRLSVSPTHMDSIIDIGGYARTMAMILDVEDET
jgi:hypothetical protein